MKGLLVALAVARLSPLAPPMLPEFVFARPRRLRSKDGSVALMSGLGRVFFDALLAPRRPATAPAPVAAPPSIGPRRGE